MKVNYSNIRFSGYSNIIVNSIQGNNNTSIDFIAMKLDDNGEKDLTRFREIKKIMNLPPETIENDVLTYTNCIHNQIGEIGIFSKVMLNCGEGLLIAKQELNPKEYKELEGFTLKAYTFMANLTKRIMHDNMLGNLDTSSLQNVYQEAMTRVGAFFVDRNNTVDFISNCSTDRRKIKLTSETINKKIAKSLSVLF